MKSIPFEVPIKVNERNYTRMLYGNPGRAPGHRDYNLAAGNPQMVESIYILLLVAIESRINEQLDNGEITGSQFDKRIGRLNRWYDYKLTTRKEEFTVAALEGREFACPI